MKNSKKILNKKMLAIVISVAVLIIAVCFAVVMATSGNSENNKATTITTTTVPVSSTNPTKPTEATTKTTEENNAESNKQSEDSNQDADSNSNNNEQNSSDELIMPELKGLWQNENNPSCTIEITGQSGNTIDLTITSVRNEGAQIAKVNTSVTLDTEEYNSGVRGTVKFDYVDSFLNEGVCTIVATQSVITLVVEETKTSDNVWGISNATGDYV